MTKKLRLTFITMEEQELNRPIVHWGQISYRGNKILSCVEMFRVLTLPKHTFRKLEWPKSIELEKLDEYITDPV